MWPVMWPRARSSPGVSSNVLRNLSAGLRYYGLHGLLGVTRMKHLKTAVTKLEVFFQQLDTRPGVLARRALAIEKPGDAMLIGALCGERAARTRMDGSIGTSLFDTAWAAWEMMDLGLDALNARLSRLVSWVLGQFEAGPFAPPTPVPLGLPNGAVFDSPEGASLAVRCLSARLLVRAHLGDRPAVAEGVGAIATGPQPATLNLSASVLSALALAPPEHRHHLDGLVHRIGAAQDGDGRWPGADLFHMLEALVLAGIRPARAVIAAAAPALLSLQHDSGAFDDPPNEERALIGLRALQVAAEG